MKKILLSYILLFTLICTATAQVELPAIKIKNNKGQQVVFNRIEALQSSTPVIISFWATWCIPCITELNVINEQYEERQKQSPFSLLAISVDDARTTQKVKPLVAGKGWAFDIYTDPNSDLKRALNVNEIPHVLVVKNGKIIYQHTGYMSGNEEELFEAIKKN